MNAPRVLAPYVKGRFAYLSLLDGRLAELFRPTYQDAIDAGEQPPGYRQPFFLMRSLKIDGVPASMQDVLDLDYEDSSWLVRALVRKMKM
jgi:hypothetical protein